ncbi:MAG: hypothetical protein KC925_04160 [Candidatus Doudnabacteria bacterium]|nr:hypothetical protein [Candidatus Doudnabacteria bacterium]
MGTSSQSLRLNCPRGTGVALQELASSLGVSPQRAADIATAVLQQVFYGMGVMSPNTEYVVQRIAGPRANWGDCFVLTPDMPRACGEEVVLPSFGAPIMRRLTTLAEVMTADRRYPVFASVSEGRWLYYAIGLLVSWLPAASVRTDSVTIAGRVQGFRFHYSWNSL